MNIVLLQFAAHEESSLGSASIWLMGQVYYTVTHLLERIEKGKILTPFE